MSVAEQGDPIDARTPQWAAQEIERLSRLLRESQSLARVGGWEIDLQTGTHYWTEETYKIHETNPDEYKPSIESAVRFYVPEAVPVILEAIRKLLEDGRAYEVDLELVTAKGNRIWVSTTGCLEISEGKQVRLYGFIQDITRRKRNEQALQDSEAKFAKIYYLSPDAINLTHLDSAQFVEGNSSHEKIFGYNRAELIGHSPLPGDLDLWANADDRKNFVAKLEKDNDVLQLETLMKRKNGDIFDAVISSSLIEIGGERYILSVTRDISKRKQIEEALLASEEKFSKTFQSAPVLAALSHMDNGQLIDVNDLYCQTLGFTREELIGRTTVELGIVNPDDRDRLKKMIEFKGSAKHIEHKMSTKNGHTVQCIFFGELVWVNGQKMLISMLTDITELKRKEEQDRNMEVQLQERQRMESLGVLSAGVAHNLNNVLAIVMGTASLQEQVATEPADREAYLTIKKACARGREVVKSMLHFAQPTLSSKAPIELHTLIQEVCVLLENTTRNVINIHQVFSGEPLWINGDCGSISHVILNLCLNSLRAMPDGGTLTFRTRILEGDLVDVFVEDNGTGMTPEVLAHVMEPFYTTKGVGQGTGLGLSMTYGVIKAHGGTIDITSEFGVGTSVRLRFPRIPAPVQIESVKPLAPSLGSMKIFLVDDDEDVRFLMTRMLKQSGVHQVKVFSGGEELLENLRSGEIPDLIIQDQNMPGMNGIQTMAMIRELHPEMPILISSGQPDIEEMDCFKQSRVGVISKPFSMDEIQAKLAEFAIENNLGQQPTRNP